MSCGGERNLPIPPNKLPFYQFSSGWDPPSGLFFSSTSGWGLLLISSTLVNISFPQVFEQSSCSCFLLQESQQMMETMSLWGPLIYAGCFAATLSSAIASIVGAPRIFQAVAKDKLFPGIVGLTND